MVSIGKSKREERTRAARYHEIGHALLKTATRAADLLVHAMGPRADADQVRRLRGILSAKSSASYSGNFYTLADGVRVLTEIRIYAEWSAEMLQERL